MKITKAEIEAVVTYNPETGDLVWKDRTAESMPSDHLRALWNKKFAGKAVGRCKSGKGDIRLQIKGRYVYARRIIHLLMTGKEPNGRLSHKDGNKDNLAWSNIACFKGKKPKPKEAHIETQWFSHSDVARVMSGGLDVAIHR